MFKKLMERFGRGSASNAPLFEPRMPEVESAADLKAVFEQARAAAPSTARHVGIVTPERLLMLQPCPQPGSMSATQVDAIEKTIPSQRQRNIAAIAYTELTALQQNIAKSIPFLGMLLGFAYIGHTVWVFEGHETALAEGCRDADVLIVDGGMLAHLPAEWSTAAAGLMRRREIYVHDRSTFRLQRWGT